MANRMNAPVDYETLVKILQYELKLGCHNKAVITGLEPFVAHWQEESLGRGASEQDRSQILGIVDTLKGYADLDPADRLTLLSHLLERINKPAPLVMKPATPPAPVPETAPAPTAAAALPDCELDILPCASLVSGCCVGGAGLTRGGGTYPLGATVPRRTIAPRSHNSRTRDPSA